MGAAPHPVLHEYNSNFPTVVNRAIAFVQEGTGRAAIPRCIDILGGCQGQGKSVRVTDNGSGVKD